MWDTNALFANNATITANGNSSILDLGPSASGGEFVEFVVTGAVTGTTPTLTVKVQASDSATFASGVRDIGAFAIGTGVYNATGQRDTILVQHEERYLRLNYVLSGTTPSFAGCYGGIVSGPQRDDTV